MQMPLERPIRVVVFGSGPRLNPDVEEFLCRLDAHPEIELLAVICQASSQSFYAVAEDLWQRRGLLAFPLLASRMLATLGRVVAHSHEEVARPSGLTKLSARLHFVKDIHAPEVLGYVRALGADLGLIYGSPMLKPSLFTLPLLGTLGIHHGKVPEYRGNKTTFWAMYNGEPTAGVTIQHVNAGLDTGKIVKEGVVVTASRSYRAVVRNLEALGLDLYLQAILEIKHGTATTRAQAGRKGKLYRNPTARDFVVFWTRQARRRFGWQIPEEKKIAPGG
jgi:folate-dependent phosphoribosylglycinamide formyltransferase PurN